MIRKFRDLATGVGVAGAMFLPVPAQSPEESASSTNAELTLSGPGIPPLGASGTKLMTTLVHALGQRGKRYGLQTMCEGGGMANVTIVERL